MSLTLVVRLSSSSGRATLVESFVFGNETKTVDFASIDTVSETAGLDSTFTSIDGNSTLIGIFSPLTIGLSEIYSAERRICPDLLSSRVIHLSIIPGGL